MWRTEFPLDSGTVPKKIVTTRLHFPPRPLLSSLLILSELPNSYNVSLSNHCILNFLNLWEGLCVGKRTIALQKPCLGVLQNSIWMLGFQSKTSAISDCFEVDFYTALIRSPFSIGNQENLWSLLDSRIVSKPCQDRKWKRHGVGVGGRCCGACPASLHLSPPCTSIFKPGQFRVPSRITHHWANKNNGC